MTYYIWPSCWNEAKFQLRKGMSVSFSSEPPEYAGEVCKALNITICNTSPDDNSVRTFCAPPVKTLQDGSLEPDWESTKSENWSGIEDEKQCWVECAPYNICLTLRGFGAFLKKPSISAMVNLGYKYKPLFWSELLEILENVQKRIVYKCISADELEIAELSQSGNFSPRISIFPDQQDDIESLGSETAEFTQIVNTDKPGCYRRSAVARRFGWKENALSSEKAYFSYVPGLDVYDFSRCVYDRTDNWTGSGADESWILDRADIVICSSKWLYNDTKGKYPEKKVFYVPNGNFDFEKENPEKQGKTAIYAGRKLNKVNMEELSRTAKENPEWTIKVFAENSDWLTMLAPNIEPHDFTDAQQIFRECEKCSVGLCLLTENDYTKGMLPNKVFLYGNAGIPCAYSGIPDENVEDYGWCVKMSGKTSLDDIASGEYEFKKRTWDNVCDDIQKILTNEGFI